MPIFFTVWCRFFTVYAGFSRFVRDINGGKKNISLSMSFCMVSFSRFTPSRTTDRIQKTERRYQKDGTRVHSPKALQITKPAFCYLSNRKPLNTQMNRPNRKPLEPEPREPSHAQNRIGVPKGPSRTKKHYAKKHYGIVNYYGAVFFTTPPQIYCAVNASFKRVKSLQFPGIWWCAAIVNHYAIANFWGVPTTPDPNTSAKVSQ